MPVATSDRCCCGCIHVKTGTWILIVVQLVIAIWGIVSQITQMNRNGQSPTREWITLIISAVFLVSCILAVVALVKNRPQLMLLHMVVCVVYIVWVIIQLVWAIVANVQNNVAFIDILWLVIVWGIVIVVLTYLLYVEYCCYKWLGGQVTV